MTTSHRNDRHASARRLAPALLPAALLLGGCAGHSARYKVDDVVLAQVPVEEKQAIFTAENDVAVARSEKQKVESELATTHDELGRARKERELAVLEIDKAKVEAKIGESLKDAAHIQRAGEMRRVADIGKRAADAKVEMLEDKKRFQEAVGAQADAHLDAALSLVELEKAKLAVAKNITPSKDFDAAKFATDYDQRVKRQDERRVEADRKREKYERAVSSFNERQAEWERVRPAQP